MSRDYSVNSTQSVDDNKEGEPMRENKIVYEKLPWAIWLLEKLGLCSCGRPTISYKLLILVLTYCCYTSYHLSRKPSSVVKVSLCPECAHCNISALNNSDENDNATVPGWAPFNDHEGHTLLGVLDYSWLFSYAIAMYFSGFLSDRVNLRYFLTIGMLGSGISGALLGVAYFADMHKLYYFIFVQVFGGVMQSTGWPGVVAVMSHWFGKHNRGLIMGIWNSHTSVGNILGTIIPSFWAKCEVGGPPTPWGWSFIVPGAIIFSMGILVYLFLVVNPLHVCVPPPIHHLEQDIIEPKGALRSTISKSDLIQNGYSHRDRNTVSPGSMVINEEEEVKPNGSLPGYSYQYRNTEAGGESDKEDTAQLPVVYRTSIINSKTPLINSGTSEKEEKQKAINFFRALTIPGVVEFALALFFNKLVSYTFLFWLPLYVKVTHSNLSGPESDWLSTVFDVGGIIGAIIAGVVSDFLGARAITCVTMLLLAVPGLFILRSIEVALWLFIVLLVINGALINGPYGMITTAVSSDLGTHPSLKSNTNAKATVTAIIDGTGSLGAAVGPLLVGVITRYSNWNSVFYLLMASCAISAMMMIRLVVSDVMTIFKRMSCTRCCRSTSSDECT